MTDTYRLGVAAVVGVVFIILIIISLLELWCEVLNIESISYRVERWAGNNPWFARALILVWAILLAHFFLNPLPSITAVMLST
jgi:hypothetical protein